MYQFVLIPWEVETHEGPHTRRVRKPLHYKRISLMAGRNPRRTTHEKSTVTITLQKNVASEAETVYLSEGSEFNPGIARFLAFCVVFYR